MTIRPHDFSRPPSLHPETRAKLAQWITRANLQLTEVIATHSLHVEVQLSDCVTAWPTDELAQWSERTIAFRVKLADQTAVSVMALDNPLAQVLIGAMLGEALEAWPSEREVTPSELSVAEFFITRVLASLTDVWTSDSALEFKVLEQEPNIRRTKVFRFQEPFVVCRTTIRSEFGAGRLCWIMPHDYLTALFGPVRKGSAESELPPRQQLESLARNMSTELVINLGRVQLSAPQLAELRVGDLVVLNQKTTEPLKALVSGQVRFLGWPGRVGNRQAFEIATDGPRRERTAQTAATGELTANR